MSERYPKCKHDGLILVKAHVGGWEDYILDRANGSLEFSDSTNKIDRLGKTGVCDLCGNRVRLKSEELKK